jgi:ERCC4-related helicase
VWLRTPLQTINVYYNINTNTIFTDTVCIKRNNEIQEGLLLQTNLSALDIAKIDENQIKENIQSTSPMLNIRAYQWELIKPGLNGENYIICAPTGSGKTLMAACVIKDRLEKRGKNNAILFVVKTQQLAVQQKKKLEEYLKVFEVVEITGDHEDGKIYSILPQVDIVVCTAGKLQSELISKSLNISDVPLLVMDECHHTIGRDPYAEIMEYYLMARRESLPTPQVIGMTASPGAGSAKNKIATFAKAIEHQTKLCARLDATSGIKIVKDNVEELKKHVKPPDYENHTLPQRAPNDPFIHLVSDTMGRLEQMLPVQPSIQPPTDRSSQAYQQWLKNEIDVAQLSGTDESDQRNQISILEQLEAYTLAYITYEDFEFEHAMEDLTDVIIKDDEVMNATEKVIQDIHREMLSQFSQMEICPNPLLKYTEELLYKHFSAKPDSKAIFFVRDKKHTNYVTKWIKSSVKLESLVKPASISGYSRKGMSIQEQRATIDEFRCNSKNLLVSTSVLEEGLDIPECNMVIRFQMMTNEIAEVQAQGRARAENSTLHNITVSNSNTLHHRLLNIGRKEMARDAVDHLARHGIAKHRILDIQSHILSQRDERIRAEVENKKRWKTQNVELHCRKCHNFACKATDVCQYGVHYIVPNTAFIEERMKKMRRKGGRAEPKEADGFTRPLKIGCKNCGEEWGAWGVWENGIQCPLLKCEKFTYYNKQTGHRENCKKWKNVPFEVVFYDELIEEHNKEVDD